jgi:integrase/recombinase XerC/integrase/recombinase XerD
MNSVALTTSSQVAAHSTDALATLQDGAYLESLLLRFAASQDVAPSSRATYLRTVRQFFRWVQEQALPLSVLTRVEVLRYREDLLASGMSSLSVGAYLTSVRRFFAWAEGEKVYPNIARDVKGPKRKQQFRKQALTAAKAKEVLSYQDGQGLRDHAILNVLLRTGLRTIEVVRANVEDITYKAGTRVLLVHGKGRSERDAFVILTDTAHQPIADYLATRGKVKAGEPLFTSHSNNSKGGRLTTRTVSGIAKESLRSVGLDSKEYTAHSLRHTTAVTIMRAGGSIEDAQHVLRHSSPATTQIYTATIKEELRLRNSTESLLDRAYA